MRGVGRDINCNTALTKVFSGRCPMNGDASVASWTQGGLGMGLPTKAATGKYTIALKDPPGGVYLGADVVPTTTFANLANAIECRVCEWNATTNTLTFATCTTGSNTAAAPPAAAAGYEFLIQIYFSQSENK